MKTRFRCVPSLALSAAEAKPRHRLACPGVRQFAQLAGCVALLGSAGCGGSAIESDGNDGDEAAHGEAVWASSASQSRMDSFYALGNSITVRITMPSAEWSALKNEQPKGGREYIGSRFDWHKATSVTIETSAFPTANGSFTFANVGIKKKSWLGSFSTTKPAFKLDYNEYDKNGIAADNKIGTRHLMFNNSIQDPSYVRQCLGYKLFRDAGLPAARCNFASVYVNNEAIGVYVNVEEMDEKPFVEKNFNGNVSGNLYEIEVDEDFVIDMVDRMEFKGFSPFSNKMDLSLTDYFVSLGALDFFDTKKYMDFWAMEILLKHWDGYNGNRNNTYVYNDVVAQLEPGMNDIKFKFIPSGIDQILGSGPWEIYQDSVLAKKMVADPAKFSMLRRTVYDALFWTMNPRKIEADIDVFAQSLRTAVNSKLGQVGAAQVSTSTVNGIVDVFRGVRVGVNSMFNVAPTPTSTVRILSYADFRCLHWGSPSVGPSEWNVDHKPCGTSSNYYFNIVPSSKPGYFKIQYTVGGVVRTLRADTTHPVGFSYDVYWSGNTGSYAAIFGLIPNGDVGGYQIQSTDTGLCLHFSASMTTSDGNLEVYQAPCDESPKNLVFFWP